MSRLRNFARALVSGYLMLGANIVYTLASVPLALHFLDKSQFGLWALTTQITSYIMLIDGGMTSSISRILIDHKDDRATGHYGAILKTGALVGLVQGLLILIFGAILSLAAGPLLKVPPELQTAFFWLMLGQTVITALNFATRIFSQLLTVHQRLDITNHASTGSFLLGLAGMALGFSAGIGIYSLLLGQFIMFLAINITNALGCLRLRLFPRTGEWGAASFKQFYELFVFGQGMFLISIGTQFINASQTILLTRILGLETAAIWTVGTRAYTMLTMVIWRILDYSAPGLSEMVARREHEKFKSRMRDLVGITASLSVVAAAIFAITNSRFVTLWTAGKISWPIENDLLLALWLVACGITRAQSSLPILVRNLNFLKFIYLLEGAIFIALTLLGRSALSTTSMLAFSLACTSAFSLPYSIWRIREYFDLTWREWVAWLRPMWALSWRLLPVTAAIWYLTHNLPAYWQLGLTCVGGSLIGCVFLLKYGLGDSMRAELEIRTPPWARKILFLS